MTVVQALMVATPPRVRGALLSWLGEVGGDGQGTDGGRGQLAEGQEREPRVQGVEKIDDGT